MREFIVKKNDESKRLDSFLQRAVPLLPQGLMYKYLRLKRIKVNGKKCEISYRLKIGDVISLYLNDEYFERDEENEFLRAPADIKVVFEDENLLICDKPFGLCVHADNDGSVDTLINRVLHYLSNKGEFSPGKELSFTPSLCNRIDRNTGGMVIVAKTAEALRVMNEKIKNREIKKYYLCVVSGIMKPPSDTVTHYIERTEGSSTVKVFDKPNQNTKTAVSSYKTLRQGEKNALLEVELHTGRTHQIRAQMAHIGHPLIGDGKYGNGSINRSYGVKKQLLYSYRLIFAFKDENPLSYLNGREFKIDDVWFEHDERFF